RILQGFGDVLQDGIRLRTQSAGIEVEKNLCLHADDRAVFVGLENRHSRTGRFGRFIPARTLVRSRAFVWSRPLIWCRTFVWSRTLIRSRTFVWSRTLIRSRTFVWSRTLIRSRTFIWPRTLIRPRAFVWSRTLIRSRAFITSRTLVISRFLVRLFVGAGRLLIRFLGNDLLLSGFGGTILLTRAAGDDESKGNHRDPKLQKMHHPFLHFDDLMNK